MTITRPSAAVVLAGILLLAGCSSAPLSAPAVEPGTSSESSADESAYGGFAIDPPADDEIVLTIDSGSPLEFSYAELQQLATAEISILEPFVNTSQSFIGVPLAELLELALVSADDRIETIALNDYRYSDDVATWIDNEALLAVYRDGELIPMDQGGPIRIVFAEDSAAYGLLDAWNWSLRTISVVE